MTVLCFYVDSGLTCCIWSRSEPSCKAFCNVLKSAKNNANKDIITVIVAVVEVFIYSFEYISFAPY